MTQLSRYPILAVMLLAGATAAPVAGRGAAQSPQAPAARSAGHYLSLDEQEQFLATARILRTRNVSIGVTGTVRATLSDGRVTHDASIQTVDEYRQRFESRSGVEFEFRDSWRYNVAAYRLDRLLDLGMVPPSVRRVFKGEPGAFTWWVDDVLMDEGGRLKQKIPPPDVRRWNEQMWHVRLFDQWIHNVDRNMGNLLIDTGWRIWMIDHSRAFRLVDEPRSLESVSYCDRAIFARLKALDKPAIVAAVGNLLSTFEVDALLARRDVIVRHIEASHALFDWDRPPRPAAGAAAR